MYECTLFGLDEAGKVLATEELEVRNVDDAVRHARDCLREFPSVELWQSFVCVARLHQPRAAGRLP